MADPATIYTGIVTAAEVGALVSAWGTKLVGVLSTSIENLDWGSVAQAVLGKVFSKDEPSGITLDQLVEQLNRVMNSILQKMGENREKDDLEEISSTLYPWSRPGGYLVKLQAITKTASGLTKDDIRSGGVLSELADYLDNDALKVLDAKATKYGSFEGRFKTLGLADSLATLISTCHELVIMTAMSSAIDAIKWSTRPGYTTIPDYYRSVDKHPVVLAIIKGRTLIRAWCDAYLDVRRRDWRLVKVRRRIGEPRPIGDPFPITQYYVDQGGDDLLPRLEGKYRFYPGNPFNDLWAGNYGPSAGTKVQATFDAWAKIYNATECIDKQKLSMDVVYPSSSKVGGICKRLRGSWLMDNSGTSRPPGMCWNIESTTD